MIICRKNILINTDLSRYYVVYLKWLKRLSRILTAIDATNDRKTPKRRSNLSTGWHKKANTTPIYTRDITTRKLSLESILSSFYTTTAVWIRSREKKFAAR